MLLRLVGIKKDVNLARLIGLLASELGAFRWRLFAVRQLQRTFVLRMGLFGLDRVLRLVFEHLEQILGKGLCLLQLRLLLHILAGISFFHDGVASCFGLIRRSVLLQDVAGHLGLLRLFRLQLGGLLNCWPLLHVEYLVLHSAVLEHFLEDLVAAVALQARFLDHLGRLAGSYRVLGPHWDFVSRRVLSHDDGLSDAAAAAEEVHAGLNALFGYLDPVGVLGRAATMAQLPLPLLSEQLLSKGAFVLCCLGYIVDRN